MKALITVVALATAWCFSGCASSYDARLTRLEKDQDFVFQMMRGRPTTPERCASYSYEGRTCQHNEKAICSCRFDPDRQDIENAFAEKRRREQEPITEPAPTEPAKPEVKSGDE